MLRGLSHLHFWRHCSQVDPAAEVTEVLMLEHSMQLDPEVLSGVAMFLCDV